MTQEELITNFINNLDYNFTNQSKLILISEILNNLINEIQFEVVSDKEKIALNTLNTMLLSINELLESEE